jgi:hypothetical protein
LLKIAEKTGLNGLELVRSSKLSAKVDNTAIQDGFQLYLHSFILSDEGEWAVVQQGMNDATSYARRYHWHSANIRSFVEEPHTFIYGRNQGNILNLVDKQAQPTRQGVLDISKERTELIIPEIRKIIMPSHHEVRATDVDLKRLGSVLAVAHEKEVTDFESLLLIEGLGPRTLQSLVLISEVIHGTPSRFTDPARFSFAHGGKDGHPFPVPTKVYDESIKVLKDSVEKAKIGLSDKQQALKSLNQVVMEVEKSFEPNTNFDKVIQTERQNSYKYGGRTVFGRAKAPEKIDKNGQMNLF